MLSKAGLELAVEVGHPLRVRIAKGGQEGGVGVSFNDCLTEHRRARAGADQRVAFEGFLRFLLHAAHVRAFFGKGEYPPAE
jgi:hypothetical protein